MRKALAGLLIGIGAAAIVLALAHFELLDTAELKLYDWRMRLAADPASVNPDIVLVEINDLSIRDLEPVAGRWPWPRVLQSNLIDFIARGKPRVIAYDVLLTEQTKGTFPFLDHDWTGAQSDAAFADSVRGAGNVILLANAVDPGAEQARDSARWPGPAYSLGPAIEERPQIVPPFPALSDAAAGLGHNFLAIDPDGPARRMPPFVRSGDRYLPSLGIAAALKAGGFSAADVALDGDAIRIRDRRIPLVRTRVRDSFQTDASHDQLTMLIDFRAPAALPNGERPDQDVRGTPPPRLGGSDRVRREAARGSRGLHGQDRLRRAERGRPARRLRDAIRIRRDDAGHPAARQHGRQRARESFHRAGPRRRAARIGCRGRACRRPDNGVLPVLGGRGGHGVDAGGMDVVHRPRVRRRRLDQPGAAGGGAVRQPCSRPRPIAISSRVPRSEK